ncbi:MAG: SDR family oxidoreductase [Actinobacteria bacterium]|nr:SDR family oxidoreductase [Actinomycetota bacterium]
MIVITGATGALNGATVDHLLERVPAREIAVAVRDPARAQRFADQGVEVRRADYADPASLPLAFDGADQLLLVSASDPGVDPIPLHRQAVDAAVQAGVGRVLYTSHQGANPDSPFIPARNHAATERLLAESGLAWTALRNGFYAHSLGWLLGRWRDTGTIAVPADGPVSWTAREDSAEAAAVILASRGAYDGPTTLTASSAPTFQDIAVMAGEIAGQTVTCEDVGEQAWLNAQIGAGQDERLARFTLGIFQAANQGMFATVDPLLATLLGREPLTIADVLFQPVAR